MARQYGVASREQVTDLGLTVAQIEYRVASGHWVRVERGVYRAAAAPPHDLAPTMAAALSSGGRSSHRTALHLYGAYALPPRPELVGDRSCKYAGPAQLYRKDLSGFRTVRRLGIPTLDLRGALVTAAEVLSEDELAEVVALTVSKRMINPARLIGELGDTRGRRGAGTLRHALGGYIDAAAEESTLERRVRRLLQDAGLPAPIAQYRVRVGGTTYRLDHAWPAEKVALESDGFEFHSSRASFDADRRRRNRLELAGWLVLNATHRDVERPHDLVAVVAQALVMRRAG